MNRGIETNRKKLGFHFISRLVFFAVLLVAIFILIFTEQEKKLIFDGHIGKGVSLAENLAHDSEFGMITGDKVILDTLLSSIKNEKSIIYAEIAGKVGKNKISAIYNNEKINLSALKTIPDKTEVQKTFLAKKKFIFDIRTPIAISIAKEEEESLFLDESPKEKRVKETQTIGYIRLVLSLQEPLREIRKAQIRIILILAIMVGVFSIFYYWELTSAVIRPLKKFLEGTETVKHGDLDFRFSKTPENEIGELMNSFNHMADSIKKQQELNRKQENLAAIGRTLSGVAHEIRHSFSNILALIKHGAEHDSGSFEKAKTEVWSLNQKMNDLLEFSRTGQINVEMTDVGLLLWQARELVKYRSEAEKCDFILERPEPSLKVMVDSSKLAVALSNLIRNAINAAGQTAKIKIFAVETDEYVEFCISDNGPGVSEELKEKIFEPFYTTGARGFGIGLSIADTIASAHGGKISVETGEMGGAEFRMKIPKNLEKID